MLDHLTVDQLLAYARSVAHLEPEHELSTRGKTNSLVKRMLKKLKPWQIILLLEIAEGHAAMVNGFAVRKYAEGFEVHSLTDDSEGWHTVIGDDCSCQDAKFRGKFCKHRKAVKCLQ